MPKYHIKTKLTYHSFKTKLAYYYSFDDILFACQM